MFNPSTAQDLDQEPASTDVQTRKETPREILEKNLKARQARLEKMQLDSAQRPALIVASKDEAKEITPPQNNRKQNSTPTAEITPLVGEDLFARLAIASKEERIKLQNSITHHFTSQTSQIIAMDAAGNRVAITKLYNNPKQATYQHIILAILVDVSEEDLEESTSEDLALMLNAKLKYLDEANWIRLTLLCDLCSDAQFDALYDAARTLVAEDQNKDVCFNAFLFLRSQNQQGALISNDNEDTLAPLLKDKIKDNSFYYKILTTFKGYSLAKNAIKQLMQDNEFSIMEYYDSASEEFKNLNESLLAIQLYAYYQRDHKVITPDIQQRIKTLHQKLEKSPRLYENNLLYLKSRILDQVIKNNAEKHKTTNILSNMFNQVKTGILLPPTQVQTLFLRSLLAHLMNEGLKAPTIAPEQTLLIMSFYERYVQKKRSKQETGMTESELVFDAAKINEWLIERLEIAQNTDFRKLLLLLPAQFREALFSFEGSAINPASLQITEAHVQQKPEEPKRRASFLSSFLSKKKDDLSTTKENKEEFVERTTQASSAVSQLFAQAAEKYAAKGTVAQEQSVTAASTL